MTDDDADRRTTPFLLIVQMDVMREHEDDFLREYEEHVRTLGEVPGVRVIRTRTVRGARMFMAGSTVNLPSGDTVEYVTIYELTESRVLESSEWRHAIDAGEWASRIRPVTLRRRHQLVEVVQTSHG